MITTLSLVNINHAYFHYQIIQVNCSIKPSGMWDNSFILHTVWASHDLLIVLHTTQEVGSYQGNSSKTSESSLFPHFLSVILGMSPFDSDVFSIAKRTVTPRIQLLYNSFQTLEEVKRPCPCLLCLLKSYKTLFRTSSMCSLMSHWLDLYHRLISKPIMN